MQGCTLDFSEKKTHGGTGVKDYAVLSFLFFFFAYQEASDLTLNFPKHSSVALSSQWDFLSEPHQQGRKEKKSKEKAAQSKAFSPTGYD